MVVADQQEMVMSLPDGSYTLWRFEELWKFHTRSGDEAEELGKIKRSGLQLWDKDNKIFVVEEQRLLCVNGVVMESW